MRWNIFMVLNVQCQAFIQKDCGGSLLIFLPKCQRAYLTSPSLVQTSLHFFTDATTEQPQPQSSLGMSSYTRYWHFNIQLVAYSFFFPQYGILCEVPLVTSRAKGIHFLWSSFHYCWLQSSLYPQQPIILSSKVDQLYPLSFIAVMDINYHDGSCLLDKIQIILCRERLNVFISSRLLFLKNI